MRWIDLAAMTEVEREEFVWPRVQSVLAVEIRLGPRWNAAADAEKLPLTGYFAPDPGGSVLILPEEVRDSPYVLRYPIAQELDRNVRYIARFHTGTQHWKGREERTRFPVIVYWDEDMQATILRFWNEPDAEQFVLYADLSTEAEVEYMQRRENKDGETYSSSA